MSVAGVGVGVAVGVGEISRYLWACLFSGHAAAHFKYRVSEHEIAAGLGRMPTVRNICFDSLRNFPKTKEEKQTTNFVSLRALPNRWQEV